MLGPRGARTRPWRSVRRMTSGTSRPIAFSRSARPPFRAISTRQCIWSNSGVECASGLMLIMQPNSSAAWCQRQPRSLRHGWALIPTATSCLVQTRSAFSPRSRSLGEAEAEAFQRGGNRKNRSHVKHDSHGLHLSAALGRQRTISPMRSPRPRDRNKTSAALNARAVAPKADSGHFET